MVSQVISTCGRFRIVAFEAETKYNPSYIDSKVELINKAVWIKNTTMLWGKKFLKPDTVFDYQSHNQRYTIDFVDYLLRNVKESDFVVVKMDIEGAEYDIVPDLIARNATYLVDEMFMEVHTNINTCCVGRIDRSYADARKLVRLLRDYGVYAHMWA